MNKTTNKKGFLKQRILIQRVLIDEELKREIKLKREINIIFSLEAVGFNQP
jgi:hypothetical protein